jgi:hypothetical protein
MTCKNISDYKWINIFIESNSFDNYWDFEKIEWYYKEENINIYEIYNTRKSKILPTYKIEYEGNFIWWISFDYIWLETTSSSHALSWKETIGVLTICIFWKNDNYKFNLTEKLHIAESLWNEESFNLFITNEDSILKNKDKINKKIQNIKICDKKTAEEILWLYLRSKSKYILQKTDIFTYQIDSWLFYLYWFRNHVPYFLMDNKNQLLTNEILFKWESILKTLDELWSFYYSDMNNSGIFNTKYYYYNYLTLICWIYDKLAIYTDKLYNLWEPERQLSLNSKTSSIKSFKKKIDEKNTNLLKLINKFKLFIDLWYKLRNFNLGFIRNDCRA